MYTIQDFKQMKKINILPKEVLECITMISKKMNIEHIQPEFKVEKVYSIPQQITTLLNKLTEDNVQLIQNKLIALIKNNVSDIKNISVVIFDIITTNSFYGNIYAILYVSLIKEWPIFLELFHERFQIHLQNLNTITIVSSADYDEFCKYNELNDKYKTFSQFTVHLTLQKIVNIDVLSTFINDLINMLYTLKDSNRKNVMDEIVEHLYLCILKSKPLHNQLTIPTSKLNMTGISNKVLFRLMDIMDLLKS
jgi:hypothetical protein